MRKRYLFPLILALFLAALSFVGYRWWKENTLPISGSKESVYLTIPKGKSASWIGEKLYKENLIKSPLAFKFYVQFFGKQGNINAGEFKLSPSMDLAGIVETLQGGPIELWVTIPEGLRREEVVGIFIEGLEKNIEQGQVFKNKFLTLSRDVEGSLFPDTYLFPPDASASVVVARLVQTFENKTKDLKKTGLASKYSFDEVITMASILERETITDEERPIVAGILWKRLEANGWLLQADATNQYAVGTVNCKSRIANCDDWWPILTKEDLEINSPYNSYKFKNLPPTPIANPGIKSIEAASNPNPSDYWFYIHDLDGQIHYGKTISEHNANVRKYLGK